jgi:hypothetical protein
LEAGRVGDSYIPELKNKASPKIKMGHSDRDDQKTGRGYILYSKSKPLKNNVWIFFTHGFRISY